MANIKPVPAKEFTREEPCTKVDLSNCFTQGGQYIPRAVVEARGEIGINAIKYLLKKGLATTYESGGIDWWRLTQAGEQWLATGLARHLELHPADARKLGNKPAQVRQPARIVRRPRK